MQSHQSLPASCMILTKHQRQRLIITTVDDDIRAAKNTISSFDTLYKLLECEHCSVEHHLALIPGTWNSPHLDSSQIKYCKHTLLLYEQRLCCTHSVAGLRIK